jgi:hypothetical protein
MSSPEMMTDPEEGTSRALTRFRRVDFPDPEGPMMDSTCPEGT